MKIEKEIFIDTSAFIAIKVEDDINHKKAQQFLRVIKEKRLRLHTTNFVLDEVYTYFCKSHAVAIEMAELIMDNPLILLHRVAVEDEKKAEDEVRRGRETILLIDDEAMILDVGSRMLIGLGYAVLTAQGGKTGVEVFRQNFGRIGLVILDVIMPDIGGWGAFERLQEIDPSVKVLLSSGYALDEQAKEIMAKGCKGFIQKPFSMEELSKKIREILDKQ